MIRNAQQLWGRGTVLEDELVKIVGHGLVQKVSAEFDASAADRLRQMPTSLASGVWVDVEAQLQRAYSNWVPELKVSDNLPAGFKRELEERGRAAWGKLKLDAAEFQKFLDSRAYRSWRENLITKIVSAGGFDEEISRSTVLQSVAAEWRAGSNRVSRAPEAKLADNLSVISSAQLTVGLIALALGIFVASIVRAGVAEPWDRWLCSGPHRASFSRGSSWFGC
jgi:hypothetical protein